MCGGRSWAGPKRGSEMLCVLTHGMGSTPPPPETDHLSHLQLETSCLCKQDGIKTIIRYMDQICHMTGTGQHPMHNHPLVIKGKTQGRLAEEKLASDGGCGAGDLPTHIGVHSEVGLAQRRVEVFFATLHASMVYGYE